MRRVRIIPVLLIYRGGLYKSVKFKDYKYVGDPINAVKIFNEKEVDEIVVIDIAATSEKREPNFKQIGEIAGEAFMPLAYGGGITNIDQVKKILYEGAEKVVFNFSAIYNPGLIEEAVRQFGSSSVVVSIDAKKDWLGRYRVYAKNATKNTGLHPAFLAKEMERLGAGELFINSIDRDGTFLGYDTELIFQVANVVNIPVVACGGAGCLDHFLEAIKEGASAAAAGSYFIFQRPHRAVLVTYPSQEELRTKIYSQI